MKHRKTKGHITVNDGPAFALQPPPHAAVHLEKALRNP